MLQFVQITAQYSNAVLIAILPQVSDFVRRAEIPVPTPITLQEIAQFRCSPLAHDMGGAITLTNGLWVLYMQGHVYDLRTPRSYYHLQDARYIPKFYGRLNLTKDEALQFSRAAIRRLGYSLKETFTDQEPEIEMPIKIRTNVVPYYRFEWLDPVFGKTAVRVELNAEAKRIEEIRLSSPFFWRAPPKIAERPRFREMGVVVSETASNQFIDSYLSKILSFAKALGLPSPETFSARKLETVEFLGNSIGEMRFLSGYAFTCRSGAVVEFHSPDSVYAFEPALGKPPPKPFSDYLGDWNLSESSAIDLVRHAITSLGYSLKDFNVDKAPDVQKNKPVGKYVMPRYRLYWITDDPATGRTLSMVSAEVNADKKRLEQLHLFGPPFSPRAANSDGQKLPSSRPPTTEPEMDRQTLEWLNKMLNSGSNQVQTNPPMKPKNPFE